MPMRALTLVSRMRRASASPAAKRVPGLVRARGDQGERMGRMLRAVGCGLGRIAGALGRLGHLAVWAGLYVAAAGACFGQVAGLPGVGVSRAWWAGVGFAWATAACVYLLDRVKARDVWLDPADREAHPERFAFLSRRAWWVRFAAGALAAASAGAAWLVHPLGPLVTVAAVLG